VSKKGCAPCAHAKEHGWWGPGFVGTHCTECHRSWAAKTQSHCGECHRHFGSESAGDDHRRKGKCIDPVGIPKWETANGPIWGGQDPVAMRARLVSGHTGGREESER
jgi:hypothetical protein